MQRGRSVSRPGTISIAANTAEFRTMIPSRPAAIGNLYGGSIIGFVSDERVDQVLNKRDQRHLRKPGIA